MYSISTFGLALVSATPSAPSDASEMFSLCTLCLSWLMFYSMGICNYLTYAPPVPCWIYLDQYYMRKTFVLIFSVDIEYFANKI